MTAFGNFAPFDQGTADNQTGRMPADIGLGGKGNSMLVEQAWAFSPANFIKQSGASELPTSGYGSGPRARLDDAILKNLETSQVPTGPMPLDSARTSTAKTENQSKTLRSILPALGFSGRTADTTTTSRPADLIDALSGTRTNFEARTASPLPANPFAVGAVGAVGAVDAVDAVGAVDVVVSAPTPAAAAERSLPNNFTANAKAETGPLPVVARVEARLTAAAFDVKNHPLFANISKDAKTATPYNFNARMDSGAPLESLSRQIMTADFSAPRNRPTVGETRAKVADPFAADNCYQSMEFSPDGTVKTTTTLPDLSVSKIESCNLDKSKSIALTDHLGRPTIEQRFDATGQLVSQTSSKFDHADAPMVPSHKTVQTATQTIETRMNTGGTVIASKIMPANGLDASKSIA